MTKHFLVLALIVAALSACKKNDHHQQQPHIYIGGYYRQSGGQYIPFIMKDSVRTDLSRLVNDKGGYVFGLEVQNSNVFASGGVEDPNARPQPCFWKNGERTDLSMPAGARTEGGFYLHVSGNDVYVVGSYFTSSKTFPCYWKNGVRTDLSLENMKSGEAYAITLSGNDLYACGFVVDSLDQQVPAIWKNNVLGRLGGLGGASGIFITPGSIYMAGYGSNHPDSAYGPCYWKNILKTDLSRINKQEPGSAKSMVVANGNLYIGGYTTNISGVRQPCTWINGVRTDLSVMENNRDGGVECITLAGSDVWASGYVRNAVGDYIPCYWKNGVRADILIPGSVDGLATTIKVK